MTRSRALPAARRAALDAFEEGWARRERGRALAALGQAGASEELERAVELFRGFGALHEASRCTATDGRSAGEGA